MVIPDNYFPGCAEFTLEIRKECLIHKGKEDKGKVLDRTKNYKNNNHCFVFRIAYGSKRWINSYTKD